MAADGFVESSDSVFDLVLIKQIGYFCIMGLGKGDEIIILTVLDNYVNQILEFCFPVEYFAFPVHNVFLEIECDVFGDAEILHRIRHCITHFIADSEEMIYACLACKNDCCELREIDFLGPEVLDRNPLNLNKWFKIYLKVVLFSQIKVWRFCLRRFRLRN